MQGPGVELQSTASAALTCNWLHAGRLYVGLSYSPQHPDIFLLLNN